MRVKEAVLGAPHTQEERRVLGTRWICGRALEQKPWEMMRGLGGRDQGETKGMRVWPWGDFRVEKEEGEEMSGVIMNK